MSPQPKPTPSLAEVFELIRRYADGTYSHRCEVAWFCFKMTNGQTARFPVPLDRDATPMPAIQPPTAPRPECVHGADFRSVIWYGERYTFTKNQAKAVQLLWLAWDDGTLDVSQDTLLRATGSESARLVDVFRDHPAWGRIIVKGAGQGMTRLARPVDGAPED